MILESVDVVQFDHSGEIVRDARERRADLLTSEPGRHFLEDDVIVAGHQLVVLLLQTSDGDQLPAPGVPLFRFAQHAPKNAVEPGSDFGGVPQLVKAEPGPSTCLLHRIFGVGERGGAARGERQQTIEVRQHERVEARVPVLEGEGEGRRNGKFSDGERTYCR